MKDVAIKVENLSKRYRIGLKEETQDTLFGALGSILKSPFQNLKRLKKLTSFNENNNGSDDIIWALKDVPSLELNRMNPFKVSIYYDVNKDIVGSHIGVMLDKFDKTPICHTADIDSARNYKIDREVGSYISIRFKIIQIFRFFHPFNNFTNTLFKSIIWFP